MNEKMNLGITILLVLILTMGLTRCTDLEEDISNYPEYSKLIGTCFVLTEDLPLSKSVGQSHPIILDNKVHSSNPNLAKFDKISNQLEKASMFMTILPRGTKITVKKVIKLSGLFVSSRHTRIKIEDPKLENMIVEDSGLFYIKFSPANFNDTLISRCD